MATYTPPPPWDMPASLAAATARRRPHYIAPVSLDPSSRATATDDNARPASRNRMNGGGHHARVPRCARHLRRGKTAASFARIASRSRLSLRCRRAPRDLGVRLRARPLGLFLGGEYGRGPRLWLAAGGGLRLLGRSLQGMPTTVSPGPTTLGVAGRGVGVCMGSGCCTTRSGRALVGRTAHVGGAGGGTCQGPGCWQWLRPCRPAASRAPLQLPKLLPSATVNCLPRLQAPTAARRPWRLVRTWLCASSGTSAQSVERNCNVEVAAVYS